MINLSVNVPTKGEKFLRFAMFMAHIAFSFLAARLVAGVLFVLYFCTEFTGTYGRFERNFRRRIDRYRDISVSILLCKA